MFAKVLINRFVLNFFNTNSVFCKRKPGPYQQKNTDGNNFAGYIRPLKMQEIFSLPFDKTALLKEKLLRLMVILY
jgi:hypothetical protein